MPAFLEPPAHRLCVAPMMDRTDRHFRYLVRSIEPRAWLYTEMIVASALVRGNAARLLAFDRSEHPVALQLGGADPDELVAAARLGERAGYDEINLNVGCPSSRVRAGAFGAALMLEPERVAACVAALVAAVDLPVTVKTRIGVDHNDSYDFLRAFAERVAAAGCRTLIVHARKAWLEGLSPKQNREIPPLDPARVHRLKRDLPALEIVINGGLRSVAAARAELEHVDGVMLGRAAYADPLLVGALGRSLFGDGDGYMARTRADVLASYAEYMHRELAAGTPLQRMARHLTGLVTGIPGARAWRRRLARLREGYDGLAEIGDAIAELGSDGPKTTGSMRAMYRVTRTRYNPTRMDSPATR